MTTDAVIQVNAAGYYDFSLDDNGDIYTADFFDTSLLYSIYGERRASPDEVVEPQLRRGWIGNGDPSDADYFENGSKLWLFEQARATRTNFNRIENEAKVSLQWFVDDGYAVSIDDPSTIFVNGSLALEAIIRRSRDKVDRRLFVLWENTGNV